MCHFLLQGGKKTKKEVLLGAAHYSTGGSEDYVYKNLFLLWAKVEPEKTEEGALILLP